MELYEIQNSHVMKSNTEFLKIDILTWLLNFTYNFCSKM